MGVSDRWRPNHRTHVNKYGGKYPFYCMTSGTRATARSFVPKSGRSWPFAKRVDCTAPSLRTTSSLNIRYVLMMFSRPFRLHPLHLCSLVRRFSGPVRKFATRAARPVTVLTENPPARHTEFSLGTVPTVQYGRSIFNKLPR